MTPIKENWQSTLAVLIAVLALYFASLRIDLHRPAQAQPQAPVTAPAPDPADAKPVTNEIPSLQQLG